MKKLNKTEIIFLISAILLIIAISFGTISALSSLSLNLVNAFSQNPGGASQIKFNLEAAEKLNLTGQ